jgi:hypothetical protein
MHIWRQIHWLQRLLSWRRNGLFGLLSSQAFELFPHLLALVSRELGESEDRRSEVVILGEQVGDGYVECLGQFRRFRHVGLIDFTLVAIDQCSAPVLVTKSDSFTVSAIVTFNTSYDVRCAGTGFDMLVDGRAVSLPSDMPAFNRYEYAILSFGKKMTLAAAGAFAGAKK